MKHNIKAAGWSDRASQRARNKRTTSYNLPDQLMIAHHDIQAAVTQIVRGFNPRQVILFGSYAYGNPTEDSDVDLLILMNGRHVHDRALDIRNAINFPFPLDLLVRSPEEFDRRIAWGDFFLREIRDKGKILYEAADARVDKKGRRRFRHGAARGPGAKVPQSRQRVLSRAAMRWKVF
jgi:predicted nucleotidyltransferase